MTLRWKAPSPVGTLYLAASDEGLSGLWFREPETTQDAPWLSTLNGPTAAHAFLRQTVRELDEYFAGKRSAFDVPIVMVGTPFQKRVWAELAKISYGETVSYRDIATRIGQAGAVRAVGTANGRNPVSIIVPCHRVIQAYGTLGGYGGGLPAKRHLLSLETHAVW